MRKNDNLTSPPRTRTSVAISGLDRSTPDDIVKDGACEELHNLRYKDAAWRPVSDFSSVQLSLDSTRSGKICYKHPATSGDKYIYVHYDGATRKWLYYEISTSTESLQDATLIASFDDEQKVSHFGNILMFVGSHNIAYYLLRKGVYVKHNLAIAPKVSFGVSEFSDYDTIPNYFKLSDDIRGVTAVGPKEYFKANTWYHSDRLGEAIKAVRDWNAYATSGGNYATIAPTFTCLWLLSDADKLEPLIPMTPDPAAGDLSGSSWHGEIALFAAYHTTDGKVQLPSALSIFVTDNELPPYTFTQRAFFSLHKCDSIPFEDPDRQYIGCELNFDFNADLSVAVIRERCPYSYKLPTVNVHIDSHLNTSLISGVAIYATRINPVFNAALHVTSGGTIPPHKLWCNNKLPEQPFYLVKEFRLDADEEGDYVDHYTLELDSSVLQQSLTNNVYTPSVDTILTSDVQFDYNNALHLASVHSSFREDGVLADALISDGATDSTPYIRLSTDDKHYFIKGASVSSSGILQAPYNRIISYHDYRASAFIVDWKDSSMHPFFPLSPAVGNNIAYYIAPSTDYYKFPSFSASGIEGRYKETSFPEVSDTLYEPNRIQVSTNNNCLDFPFSRSYTVGSANNRIIAMQSSAIKIGDEQVGSLPLYVFTTEGIFALRAGENTLYAAVNPINYDKIINPNTLAINGAVVYITEKGVHLLSGAESQVISSPIHDKDGRPPLDFLRTCQIMWPKEHNEVIFHNPDNGEEIAYVFNLDAGYWSTRSLKGTKINTDEMVDNNAIYDLTHEDVSKTLAGAISTRPIKLGNVEFKRADTIIPRLSTGSTSSILSFNALGSVDGFKFHPLRKCTLQLEPNKVNPIVIRRTPFSAKYFKFIFGLDHSRGVPFSTAITHIDMEWYTKFQRRMR